MPRDPSHLRPDAKRRTPTTVWLASGLCGLLLLVISLSVGCKPDSKPSAPPAAAAPPPPPPPPPPLTADEVSARMRPLFVAVYEHGFNPTTLASPTRSGTAAAQPSAKTPSLTVLLEKECAKAGIDAATVVKCAADVQQKLTKRQARDAVLAIYVDQALADADAGNLHRAHVLLSDVLNEISESQAGDFSASITGLRRLFKEVPDKERLQAFAQQLDNYMLLAEESILLRGEHAAVLHAAGLVDAAEFARSKLLTQFKLVTLPLIDLAIVGHLDFRMGGVLSPPDVFCTQISSRRHVIDLAEGPETCEQPLPFALLVPAIRFRVLWHGF